MNRKQRRANAKAGARADPAGAALAAAVQHHQGGRLEEAATLYGKIADSALKAPTIPGNRRPGIPTN
jgi:hypothetical protein